MEALIKTAKQNGLCKEWLLRMKRKPTLENLCKMYFLGSDWAIEKNFPPLEFARKYKNESRKFGIYTDITKDTLFPKYHIKKIVRMAFLGNSEAEVTFEKYEVAQIIVRHNSKVKIIAKDFANISVIQLDNAVLEQEIQGNATISIFNK